jgi:hypothetical protein
LPMEASDSCKIQRTPINRYFRPVFRKAVKWKEMASAVDGLSWRLEVRCEFTIQMKGIRLRPDRYFYKKGKQKSQ